MGLEVFSWVIGSISDGFYSVRLYFGSIISRIRVTTGYTQVVLVSHSSVEISYSSYQVSISSVSFEVRIEFQSILGCHP